MSIVEKIRGSALNRLRYHRTRRAIENLPLDVALDLDIYRGDAKRIARQAVYGA